MKTVLILSAGIEAINGMDFLEIQIKKPSEKNLHSNKHNYKDNTFHLN